MTNDHNDKPTFRGYSSPNYTPVPDELFDEQLPDLSGAELKVLLYVIRRTFGFKRESDTISLSQMLNGLRTRDGRVLDRGVGLSKKTLLLAIKSLEDQNIVLTERRRSLEKGDEPTVYRLNVRPASPRVESTPPVGEKLHQGGGGEIPPGPWGKNYTTQETVNGQTDENHSKFERSRPSELTEDDPTGRGAPPLTEPNRPADEATEPVRREEPVAETRGVPLGEVLELRRRAAATIGQGGRSTDAAPPPASPVAADRPALGRNGRLKGTTEERERLAAFLGDFAAELGDEASLASSITRALNLFRTANVPPELWGDRLYQARAVTQERTAQITKQSSNGRAIRRKNKMPYFFEVLEDLLGLRPESSSHPATSVHPT